MRRQLTIQTGRAGVARAVGNSINATGYFDLSNPRLTFFLAKLDGNHGRQKPNPIEIKRRQRGAALTPNQ